MAARGDNQSFGKWQTAIKEKSAMLPAWACSCSSFRTKVVSFVLEECASYLMALVSSVSVMPRYVLIGTLCTCMCSRSAVAGCGFFGAYLAHGGLLPLHMLERTLHYLLYLRIVLLTYVLLVGCRVWVLEFF